MIHNLPKISIIDKPHSSLRVHKNGTAMVDTDTKLTFSSLQRVLYTDGKLPVTVSLPAAALALLFDTLGLGCRCVYQRCDEPTVLITQKGIRVFRVVSICSIYIRSIIIK